jgi:hypothetical protein
VGLGGGWWLVGGRCGGMVEVVTGSEKERDRLLKKEKLIYTSSKCGKTKMQQAANVLFLKNVVLQNYVCDLILDCPISQNLNRSAQQKPNPVWPYQCKLGHRMKFDPCRHLGRTWAGINPRADPFIREKNKSMKQVHERKFNI